MVFLIILVMVLLVGLLYIPQLKIDEVKIAGVNQNEEEELKKWISDFLKGKHLSVLPFNNIFLFPGEKMKADVLSAFPELKSVSISNRLEMPLKVNVRKRDSVGLWCSDNNCGFVDDEGVVFKKAPYFSGSLFLKFFSASTTIDFKIGSRLIEEDQFKKLIEFVNLSSAVGVQISKITIKEEKQYELETASGWRILLGDTGNAKEASQNLEITLNNKIENKNELDYIDLRFGNKIFYKFKE